MSKFYMTDGAGNVRYGSLQSLINDAAAYVKRQRKAGHHDNFRIIRESDGRRAYFRSDLPGLLRHYSVSEIIDGYIDWQ